MVGPGRRPVYYTILGIIMATIQSYYIGQNQSERASASNLLVSIHSEYGFPLMTGYTYVKDEDQTGEAPHPGSLGDKNKSKRTNWAGVLEEANVVIQRTEDIYSNAPEDFRSQVFPEFEMEYWNPNLYFNTTDFEASDGSNWFISLNKARAERLFWGEDGFPTPQTVRNLILIYQALLGDTSYNPFPQPVEADGHTYLPRPLPTDGILGRWSIARVTKLIYLINSELDLRENLIGGEVATQEYITSFHAINYEQDDISFIMNNNNFSRFFSTTFDSDTISLIPLIYNFYLTSEYFQGINEAFKTPKDRVLDIILSTIANDNNFDSTPDMSRPAAAAAIANSTGQDQQSAFNSASRDFILKMLIKTPIDILKGLTELIDPHVAITKVIKTGTGFAFNAAAAAIDPVVTELNEQITTATEDFLIPIEPSLTGEDLLTLLFCLIENGMTAGLEAAEGSPDAIPENFFPRVSMDGIDFTGTVSGMLMMPPSPLGLIYLLLELLKNDVTNQTQNVIDANTENADANECDDTTEIIDEESPCDDPPE